MQSRRHFGATLLHIPLIYSLKQFFLDADITLFSKNASAKMLVSVTAVNDVNVTKDKLKVLLIYKKTQCRYHRFPA